MGLGAVCRGTMKQHAALLLRRMCAPATNTVAAVRERKESAREKNRSGFPARRFQQHQTIMKRRNFLQVTAFALAAGAVPSALAQAAGGTDKIGKMTLSEFEK